MAVNKEREIFISFELEMVLCRDRTENTLMVFMERREGAGTVASGKVDECIHHVLHCGHGAGIVQESTGKVSNRMAIRMSAIG